MLLTLILWEFWMQIWIPVSPLSYPWDTGCTVRRQFCYFASVFYFTSSFSKLLQLLVSSTNVNGTYKVCFLISIDSNFNRTIISLMHLDTLRGDPPPQLTTKDYEDISKNSSGDITSITRRLNLCCYMLLKLESLGFY